jgi:hypothetical protein
MKDKVSKSVHCVSWVAVILSAVATVMCVSIIRDQSGWAAIGFSFFVAPALVGGSLLLGVIPSGILYYRGRQRIDLLSLWMSSTAGLAVAVEAVVIHQFPMSGC